MVGIPGNSNWLTNLRALGQHQQTQQTSLERLTTGKQINRAADDPSGVVVAQDFKVRQLEITKKLDGFERETARLGATEGGLSVLQDMVIELSGLIVKGANTGALSQDEQNALGIQIDGILKGIDHIAQSTMFNGDQILIGYSAAGLGLTPRTPEGETPMDLKTLVAKDPEAAQTLVKGAEERISGSRAAIGNRMRAIDAEMNVLREEFAGNASVLSRIEDADYAKESAELVRSQILEQATVQAIRIERENAERVLDLIAGTEPR